MTDDSVDIVREDRSGATAPQSGGAGPNVGKTPTTPGTSGTASVIFAVGAFLP